VIGLYENGPLSARLTYNSAANISIGAATIADDLYLNMPSRGSPRLLAELQHFENATIFFDWTNILMEPFGVTLSSRRDAHRGEFRASCVRETPCRWACASALSHATRTLKSRGRIVSGPRFFVSRLGLGLGGGGGRRSVSRSGAGRDRGRPFSGRSR
jgi:hypothetical protein